MSAHQELFDLARQFADIAAERDRPEIQEALSPLREVVRRFSRSFSGSWLGYHSRVYYNNFEPAPPGAHFSKEWGLRGRYSNGTVGDWAEYDYDGVKSAVFELARIEDLKLPNEIRAVAAAKFEIAKSELESILETELSQNEDAFVRRLKDEIEPLAPVSPSDVLEQIRPKGTQISRDSLAVGQGLQVPPHVAVESEVSSIELTFRMCKAAADAANKAASHLERKSKMNVAKQRVGTNVFIGHGRSLQWRELKDFIQSRLRLPWDEFNRIPVAGVTNIHRLGEMLDSAAIAFLVMTAEDEMADGNMAARQNVIHEAGLFQGRLGFSKAIVLLEEGCQEFSNINGLGQVRYPKGRIASVFEEIRLILEREGLLPEDGVA